jgi:hypothetical protein
LLVTSGPHLQTCSVERLSVIFREEPDAGKPLVWILGGHLG